MKEHDDDLVRFESEGAAILPVAQTEGYAEHDGARIWYAAYGDGTPVILLHGGFGNGGNWGYQVPALTEHGYQAVLIDSRGHGRSTRDEAPYRYERMAGDVLAVMDALRLEKAAIVGWSDGAVIALIMGMQAPERMTGVFFFGCNMDPSGLRDDIALTPVLERCLSRHRKDYARLSATPDRFDDFKEAVQHMQQTQPNYRAEELAKIAVPVTVVQSEREEFIRHEHAEYLARTIPGARLVVLEGVSHFAPLQGPEVFNDAILGFLEEIVGK